MKIATLLIALLMAVAMDAQPKKTELLDLIKALLPDSNNTAIEMNWAVSAPVKWGKQAPKKEGNKFVKNGVANILVKGKSINCEGVKTGGPCQWGVALSGNKNGFTSFSIAADNLHVQNDIDLMDYFFGKGKVKAKLIKKDTESSLYWNYQYKLQIPGKKDVWVKISYECLTATAAQAENNDYTDLFNIYFFTSKSEMDTSLY